MTAIDTSTTEGKVAVMQAHAGGAEIEAKARAALVDNRVPWNLCVDPLWEWYTYDYRVQPKPRVPREFYVYPRACTTLAGEAYYTALHKKHEGAVLCREVFDE